MIHKMKSKGLTLILSLAMVFTAIFAMMSVSEQRAYADDPTPTTPAINLVDENGGVEGILGGQGSTVYFGHYPQSEAKSVNGLTKDVDYVEAGGKNYLIEPVKWRVLDVKKNNEGKPTGEMLLFSDQSLDCKKYNEIRTGMTWENSTIRAWLNGLTTKGGSEAIYDYTARGENFVSTAFSSDEQAAIKTTTVENNNNPYFGTVGGNNTNDKVFLLSIAEVQNENYGFTNNNNRQAKNTDYAKSQGAYTNTGIYAGNGIWWLRSPGDGDNSAAEVASDGTLIDFGAFVDKGTALVRPAFNFNLQSAIFTSAAVGGKSETVGALTSPTLGDTKDWKLTIKDETHKNF